MVSIFLITLAMGFNPKQNKPQAPKPAVLALSQNPDTIDHWIVEDADRENVRKMVLKQKLITKEFKDFTFYYSPKLLGLEDAKKQSNVLKEVAQQFDGKTRRLDVSKLSPDAQNTIRGMIESIPGSDEFHAVSSYPDLKLSGGIQSDVKIRYGEKEATYNLLSRPNYDDIKATQNPQPTADQISKWKEQAVTTAKLENRVAATPFLTFIYSATVDSFQKLQYLEVIQSYLKDLCGDAIRSFREASKIAMKSVYGDFAKRYDTIDALQRPLRFSDLPLEDQNSSLSWFASSRQAGDTDPGTFLNYGNTQSIDTYFGLTILYRVGDIPNGCNANLIRFQCPVGG